MAIDRAKEHLEKYDMAHRVMEFEVSSATVALAAQAVGCEPARIAKTLSFQVDEDTVLVVAAGDAKIDNGKFKQVFKTKAKMLAHDEAESKIGHAVGGVCPFGVNERIQIYLDESLKRFDTVFPACGSSNSAIELSILELEKTSEYLAWIDVCKL